MIWLDLIGGNSGVFYLDVHTCEIRPVSGRFLGSMTGILGDGSWESPVLVEVGGDVSITLLGDNWDGLRSSSDVPDIDIHRLETAVRDALDGQPGFWRCLPERPFCVTPHRSGRRGSAAKSYPVTEECPPPTVCEFPAASRTAA